MRKTEKIILVFALFSTVLLAILSLYLFNQMNEDEILISQLNSSLNKTNERLQNNRQLIRMIIKDVKSQDKIDNEQVYLEYKNRVLGLLEEKINTIISDRPIQGGSWFLNKVDFVSPSFVVVTYEDGHELYATLLQIVKTDEDFSFIVVNY